MTNLNNINSKYGIEASEIDLAALLVNLTDEHTETQHEDGRKTHIWSPTSLTEQDWEDMDSTSRMAQVLIMLTLEDMDWDDTQVIIGWLKHLTGIQPAPSLNSIDALKSYIHTLENLWIDIRTHEDDVDYDTFPITLNNVSKLAKILETFPPLMVMEDRLIKGMNIIVYQEYILPSLHRFVEAIENAMTGRYDNDHLESWNYILAGVL